VKLSRAVSVDANRHNGRRLAAAFVVGIACLGTGCGPTARATQRVVSEPGTSPVGGPTAAVQQPASSPPAGQCALSRVGGPCYPANLFGPASSAASAGTIPPGTGRQPRIHFHIGVGGRPHLTGRGRRH
jgi:hypothetical protein